MHGTCRRIADLETDLVESEGRVMEMLAALKDDIRQLAERHSLHSDVLVAMLESRTMFDPEKEHLRENLKRDTCAHCRS